MTYYVLHNFCELHNNPKNVVWKFIKWNDSLTSLDKINYFQKGLQTKTIKWCVIYILIECHPIV